MPLALADSLGYNVAKDITHSPLFASLAGFRKRDLERALNLIPYLNADQRRGALDLMRRHYNGYLFLAARSLCTTRHSRSFFSTTWPTARATSTHSWL